MNKTELLQKAANLLAAVHSGETKPIFSQRISANRKGPEGSNSPLSATGTQLREVIEKEINRSLGCPDCLGYLRGLDQHTEHDHTEIVEYLSAQFPWPHWWREKNTRRRAAISALISSVVPPPEGLTYD